MVPTNTDRPIVVAGGSGFVGRHVVARLAASGYRVVVPTRRRAGARHLLLLPTVDVVEADIHDVAALTQLARGTGALINLVGILNQTGGQRFDRAHTALAKTIVAACKAASVRRVLQMSGLNADPAGPSAYLRSKGEAEATIAGSGLDWTIFQPSVIFGPEDAFLNLFARLLRVLPVMALARADARFQPVFVGDVAECIARALDRDETIGQRYPLCGPRVYTLRELVRYVGELTGCPRPIVPLGKRLGALQAFALELLPGTLMSRDNLASMEKDSVCGCDFPAVFGHAPTALEAVVPGYLAADAARSPYDAFRAHNRR
jgi:NADH dehydrogenase